MLRAHPWRVDAIALGTWAWHGPPSIGKDALLTLPRYTDSASTSFLLAYSVPMNGMVSKAGSLDNPGRCCCLALVLMTLQERSAHAQVLESLNSPGERKAARASSNFDIDRMIRRGSDASVQVTGLGPLKCGLDNTCFFAPVILTRR